MKNSSKKYSSKFVILQMITTGVCIIAAALSNYKISWFTDIATGWFPGVPEIEELFVTYAGLFFPFTYICSTIISEVYGFAASRKNCYINYIINLVLVIFLALMPFFDKTQNFQSARILLGSLIGGFLSVMVGDLLGDTVFQKLRDKVNGNPKTFWIRSLTSSILADIVDAILFTVLFQKIAFGKSWIIIGITLIFYIPLKIIPKLILVYPTQVVTRKLRKIEGEKAFEPRSACNFLGFYKK